MKRTVALAILGVAVAGPAFGQGHIDISNYLNAPYSQVVWDSSVATVGGQAVNDAAVPLSIWYGEGSGLAEDALTEGVTFGVNPGFAYNPGAGAGPGGYYGATTQAGLNPGAVYTFQIRASGDASAYGQPGDVFAGASALFEATPGVVANPPPIAGASPGLTVFVVPVPEPSTLALAGLGAAALLAFRRRS